MSSLCCRDAACRALILCALVIAPARLPAATSDFWLGMYFGGKKIGYTSISSAKTTYRGAPALRDISKSVTRLEVFGQVVSQTVDQTSYSDTKHRPIHQDFRMQSTGSVTSLSAEYGAHAIDCTIDDGNGRTRKQVPIPPGVRLVGDADSAQYFEHNAVGQKTTVYSLNPLTVTLDRADVEVVARERVSMGGSQYDAFKVTSDTPMGRITTWEIADGSPIRAEAPMGISLCVETEPVARDMSAKEPHFAVTGSPAKSTTGGAYVPPQDFALGTSVVSDREIEDPQHLRSLTIELQGLDNPRLALSDRRQKAAAVPGTPGAYRIEITAADFAPERALSLPLDAPASIAALALPAPYIESRDAAMVKKAAEIRGSETNAYRVASRIRAWVHQTMHPDYSIGVPRSCLDILKNPRGVCRDYATLFVSLARAAGIPARIAGGIVYMEGRFYYHAWGECWVGEWVSFDPTLPTDFVNATHIKLVEGGVTEMFGVVNVIGRLKARILHTGSTTDSLRGARWSVALGPTCTTLWQYDACTRGTALFPGRLDMEVKLP